MKNRIFGTAFLCKSKKVHDSIAACCNWIEDLLACKNMTFLFYFLSNYFIPITLCYWSHMESYHWLSDSLLKTTVWPLHLWSHWLRCCQGSEGTVPVLPHCYLGGGVSYGSTGLSSPLCAAWQWSSDGKSLAPGLPFPAPQSRTQNAARQPTWMQPVYARLLVFVVPNPFLQIELLFTIDSLQCTTWFLHEWMSKIEINNARDWANLGHVTDVRRCCLCHRCKNKSFELRETDTDKEIISKWKHMNELNHSTTF